MKNTINTDPNTGTMMPPLSQEYAKAKPTPKIAAKGI